MIKKLFVATVATLAAGAAAAAPVYDSTGVNATNDGKQAWGGTLAMEFIANGSALVTQLGVFDDDRDGISTDLYVALVDKTANAVLINGVSFNGVVNSGTQSYVFQDVAPALLTAGHTYAVQAWGFNAANENANVNAGGVLPVSFNSQGGLLTDVGTRWYESSGVRLNASAGNAFSALGFGAGSLVVSAVPESPTLAMTLAGLAAMAFMGRRRRAR